MAVFFWKKNHFVCYVCERREKILKQLLVSDGESELLVSFPSLNQMKFQSDHHHTHTPTSLTDAGPTLHCKSNTAETEPKRHLLDRKTNCSRLNSTKNKP